MWLISMSYGIILKRKLQMSKNYGSNPINNNGIFLMEEESELIYISVSQPVGRAPLGANKK